MTNTLEVADKIASQIGGRAFFMMGTRLKLGDEKSLAFDIRGTREFSKVKVTIEADDTYTVTFYKFRKLAIVRQETVEQVYADSINSVIEDKTGLRLSL